MVKATHELRAIQARLCCLAIQGQVVGNTELNGAPRVSENAVQGMDYVQPTTGAIEVMYSSNGITGTVSYRSPCWTINQSEARVNYTGHKTNRIELGKSEAEP